MSPGVTLVIVPGVEKLRAHALGELAGMRVIARFRAAKREEAQQNNNEPNSKVEAPGVGFRDSRFRFPFHGRRYLLCGGHESRENDRRFPPCRLSDDRVRSLARARPRTARDGGVDGTSGV